MLRVGRTRVVGRASVWTAVTSAPLSLWRSRNNDRAKGKPGSVRGIVKGSVLTFDTALIFGIASVASYSSAIRNTRLPNSSSFAIHSTVIFVSPCSRLPIWSPLPSHTAMRFPLS